MDRYKELAETLKSLHAPQVTLTQGLVVSIDSDDTCTVNIAGLDYPGIRMRASESDVEGKMLLVPAVGSAVTIGVFPLANEMFIISRDKVDKIIINGGDLGGMVMIEKLKKNLDALKSYCEALKSATSSGIGAVSGGYGASGKTAFDSAMSSQSISFEDMENENFKQ